MNFMEPFRWQKGERCLYVWAVFMVVMFGLGWLVMVVGAILTLVRNCP
jgi:uncharacterized membrane protein